MKESADITTEAAGRKARALRVRLAAHLAAPHATPQGGAALVLGMAEVLYGGVHRLRRWAYRRGMRPVRRLPCRVVSVGNLTVGGTGKTPLAIDLARRIQRRGRRVAVVSRGYKGACERRGGLVSDGRAVLLSPRDAGDEPYLIASRLPGVPVAVGRDRYAAGLAAWRRFGAECLVLDDGFQHLRLARDLNLVLLDFERPFGNGRLLPRGALREPVSALRRADALVITRSPPGEGGAAARAALIRRLAGVTAAPVFFAASEPYGYLVPRGRMRAAQGAVCAPLAAAAAACGRRRRGLAFSGIARNEDFLRTLGGYGVALAGGLSFPDHHAYTPREVAGIVARAREAGADFLVTTDKDHARLDDVAWPLDLLVAGVRTVFGRDEDAFEAFIDARLLGEGARVNAREGSV